MAVKARAVITLSRVNDGSPGRTYFIESSATVLKRGKDQSISPDFLEFSSWYREGTSASRNAYSGRWVIEETVDGNTWTTIYTSSANESTVTHYLHTLLAAGDSGNVLMTGTDKLLGIPRDVVQVRAKLYAAGGTTTLMDMLSVAVVTDVDALTHEEIFDLLTNHGVVQGVYKEGDQLFINATYMKIGKISSKNGKVYFDLDNNEIHCDMLISTEEYPEVSNTIAIIARKRIAGSSYTYGLQVYNRNYEDQRISIEPGRDTVPTISTGGLKGLMISSVVYNGYTTGTSMIELNPGGLIWIEPPGGHYNSQIVMYPGNYEDNDGNISSFAGCIEISGRKVSINNLTASSLTVNGTKSRAAETENYGTRLQYCYETPTPYFGDIGTGLTDETGECVISIDDILSETVNLNIEYSVFLQKEGPGELWVDSKESSYFVVKGTPCLAFSWEIKIVQKDYEYLRLDDYHLEEDISENGDLEEIFDQELRNHDKEMEEIENEDFESVSGN